MTWTILDIASKLALMGLAAYMTVNPPHKPSRTLIAVWVTVFLALGAVSIWVGVEQDTALEDALTGGDNYAYLRVRPETDQRGWNKVAIETTGALPSLHVGFYPVSPDGQVLREKQWWVPFENLPHTTFHPNIALPAGRYEINFLMGAKKWVEHLEFKRSGKAVKQVFRVERDGEVIYREPIRDQ